MALQPIPSSSQVERAVDTADPTLADPSATAPATSAATSRATAPSFQRQATAQRLVGVPALTNLLSSAPVTRAAASPTETLRDRPHAEQIVQALIDESFPELRGQKIRITTKPFKDKLSSFHSLPNIGSVLNPFARRSYDIVINASVFERGMPLDAATATLAHELAHTTYYVKGGVGGLLKALWSRVSPKFRARFERATDLEAVRRGYGDGMKTYRDWLYPSLTADLQTEKTATYLSNPEIDQATSDPNDPLWDDWRRVWPKG